MGNARRRIELARLHLGRPPALYVAAAILDPLRALVFQGCRIILAALLISASAREQSRRIAIIETPVE